MAVLSSATDPAVQGPSTSPSAAPVATSGTSFEPQYVAWVRAFQQQERRRASQLAQLVTQADPSEAADVHSQETSWALRHAHERRLHDSALAHLRHG